MALTKIGNNAIPSSAVTQHVTETDLQPVKSDISALALREATNESSAAFNLPNQFIDTFSDDTKLGTQTNVDRLSGYIASIYTNKTQFIPSQHRTSTHNQVLGTASWTGGGNTAESQGNNSSSQYSGTIINELWDLANDWQCKWFVGNSDRGGSLSTLAYLHFSIIMTDDTSISAGSDPDIFTAAASSTAYGSSASQYQDDTFIDSATRTAFNTSSLSDGSTFKQFNTNAGTGAQSFDANNGDFGVGGYYNDTNAWAGFKCVRDQSAGTIVFQPLSWDGSSIAYPSNGITTISNVPSSGRAIIICGDAYNQLRNFQTSYVNGDVSNDDFSYKSNTVTNATGTLIQSANTVGSAKTKVGGTLLYKDNQGTATLGTDLKVYFTCNGGTNWTEAPSYTAITPVYSTGIKQVRLGETTCTSGTDIRYKAVWANQASGSKETQLHGIGVNY